MDPSTSAQYLTGVGPRRAELLQRLGIESVWDLLQHVPRGYVDRTHLVTLDGLVPGAVQTTVARIARVRFSRRPGGRAIVEAELEDGRGRATAVWFNQPYLRQTLRPGQLLLVHGKVRIYQGLQIQSPEYELLREGGLEAALHGGRIVPVYPLTAGITQKALRAWVRTALESVGERLPDPIPEEIRHRLALAPLPWALHRIHYPESLLESEKARDRLAFDEFFALQLALGFVKRSRTHAATARSLRGDGRHSAGLRRSLPFTLTGGQERVLAEILEDLARDRPMNRLLQGDVGSGKTVVAALACVSAVEAGSQVAYMAPTEILAQQIAGLFERWLAPLGVSSALLLGRTRKVERRDLLARLASQDLAVVVGTHALLEDPVEFRQLGLIVVDEQHRFGVMQRARLRGKVEKNGSHRPGAEEWPHCLVMSATPIPRTLALTVYGDLDLSLLAEKPPGRVPPLTHLVRPGKREDLLRWVAGRLREGQQAFFVYPLVEESEQLDLKDATRMQKVLEEHPAFRDLEIGLLHGRMEGAEKDEVLRRFRDGSLRCLVTTTVVEVGVDVPQATLMVIEHPERFGLSQLHQLRGRVGRGGGESHLFLLGSNRLSSESRARLQVLVEESDGFRVAEEDLRLRGPGEFLGTAQHGLPPFRVGDLLRDPTLLVQAREEADRLLALDPGLARPEHAPIRDWVRFLYGKRMPLFEVG